LGFDFAAAEDKLARRQFSASQEQRQTSSAVRQVLYIEPGEETLRRPAWTESLNDHDPAAEEIQADPALQFHQEELATRAMVALKSLSARDRKILRKITIEGMKYRDVASELKMPLSSLHKRVSELHVELALLISRSRNKNPIP